MARDRQATCRRRIDPVQFPSAGLGRAFERLWPKARNLEPGIGVAYLDLATHAMS